MIKKSQQKYDTQYNKTVDSHHDFSDLLIFVDVMSVQKTALALMS